MDDNWTLFHESLGGTHYYILNLLLDEELRTAAVSLGRLQDNFANGLFLRQLSEYLPIRHVVFRSFTVPRGGS